MDKELKEIHGRNRKIKGDSEETKALAVELNKKLEHDAVNEVGVFVQEIFVRKTLENHITAEITYSFDPFKPYSIYNVVICLFKERSGLEECAGILLKRLLEIASEETA